MPNDMVAFDFVIKLHAWELEGQNRSYFIEINNTKYTPTTPVSS